MNGIKILLGFLCFRKDAILTVANNPIFIVPGFLFVLAAGLAREYDGEYLWAEPYHLVIPLFASAMACFCLVVLLWLFDFGFHFFKGSVSGRVPIGKLLICFLNFYWMTAPLALLYGIPFERYLSEYGAVLWNLRLLGIVALWRVVLMIRCTSVMFQAKLWVSAIPVLFFSCLIAHIAIRIVPFPILNFMGGLRVSQADTLLAEIALLVFAFSFLGLFIFGVAYLLIPGIFSRSPWQFRNNPLTATKSSPESESSQNNDTSVKRFSLGATYYLLAIVSILIWLPFLSTPQNEQKNRHTFEKLLHEKKYKQAIDYARHIRESDFPPYWSAPPRISYGQYEPSVESVLFYLITYKGPDWLTDHYIKKLSRCDWQVKFHKDALYFKASVEELEKFCKNVKKPNETWKLLAAFYSARHHLDKPLIPVPEVNQDRKESSMRTVALKKQKLIEELREYSGWPADQRDVEVVEKLFLQTVPK